MPDFTQTLADLLDPVPVNFNLSAKEKELFAGMITPPSENPGWEAIEVPDPETNTELHFLLTALKGELDTAHSLAAYEYYLSFKEKEHQRK